MRPSYPEPRRHPTPTYTTARCRGNGPFPLHALIQCDAFFDTNADWLSARNSRLTRELMVALPPAEVQHLGERLQGSGWEVLP